MIAFFFSGDHILIVKSVLDACLPPSQLQWFRWDISSYPRIWTESHPFVFVGVALAGQYALLARNRWCCSLKDKDTLHYEQPGPPSVDVLQKSCWRHVFSRNILNSHATTRLLCMPFMQVSTELTIKSLPKTKRNAEKSEATLLTLFWNTIHNWCPRHTSSEHEFWRPLVLSEIPSSH